MRAAIKRLSKLEKQRAEKQKGQIDWGMFTDFLEPDEIRWAVALRERCMAIKSIGHWTTNLTRDERREYLRILRKARAGYVAKWGDAA